MTTGVEDDRLRLIFTCCHPALPPDAQIALTLREVCGLTTEEIARAFLTPAPTLAQRIVRAKAKIKAARIPYQVPSRAELPERLATVLHVVYLVFNEGYAASSGEPSPGTISRPKPSGWAVSWSSSSPSPKRSAFYPSCCCTSPAARPAPRPTASWCCWTIRTGAGGTESHDRGGCRAGRAGASVPKLRPVHASGRHRRRARRRGDAGGH